MSSFLIYKLILKTIIILIPIYRGLFYVKFILIFSTKFIEITPQLPKKLLNSLDFKFIYPSKDEREFDEITVFITIKTPVTKSLFYLRSEKEAFSTRYLV